MTKKSQIPDPKTPSQLHIRTALKRYMYVALVAIFSRHRSKSKIVEGFFPQKWEREFDELLAEAKKLGHKESDFYPTKLRDQLGLKPPKKRITAAKYRPRLKKK